MGLLFWRGAKEAFNLPRATVLWLSAVVALYLAAGRALAEGAIVRPRGWAALAAAGLGAAVVVATVVEVGATSIVGHFARYDGLLTWLSGLLLFATVLIAYDKAALRRLSWALTAVAAVISLYGLLQWADLDPIGWGGERPSAFSTLGQANFAAALTAMLVPVAAARALDRNLASRTRWLAWGIVAVATGYVFVTGSFQGPLALTVGLAVVGTSAWLAQSSARRGLVAAATAAIVLVTVVVGIVSGAVGSRIDDGLAERQLLWEAGFDMASDAIVIGHGLGSFGDHFPEYRPAEHALVYGTATADAPHNVPLNLLVSGGVVLLGAYFAFVVAIGALLIRGLRLTSGGDRLLLAGFGGAWASYQAQSLVSIDVPPLIGVHLVVAGAVAVLSGTVHADEVHRRPLLGSITAAGALAILCAPVAWRLTIPLRADVEARLAADAFRSGDLVASREHLDRANELAPWEGGYWADRAQLLQQAGDPEGAVAAGERAATESPGSITYALATAQLAAASGNDAVAARWYEHLVAVDRDDPVVLLAAGRYALAKGDHRGAVARLEQLKSLRPGSAEILRYLGSAYRAAGRLDDAIETYREVVRVSPGDPEATNALEVLLAQ